LGELVVEEELQKKQRMLRIEKKMMRTDSTS